MEGVEPTYANHCRSVFNSMQSLFDAGEAVERMRGDHGWQSVLLLVDAELADIDRKLDGKNPLGHVEYAHLHGQRRGLQAARHAAQAIVTRYVAVREEQERKHEGARESVPGR